MQNTLRSDPEGVLFCSGCGRIAKLIGGGTILRGSIKACPPFLLALPRPFRTRDEVTLVNYSCRHWRLVQMLVALARYNVALSVKMGGVERARFASGLVARRAN